MFEQIEIKRNFRKRDLSSNVKRTSQPSNFLQNIHTNFQSNITDLSEDSNLRRNNNSKSIINNKIVIKDTSLIKDNYSVNDNDDKDQSSYLRKNNKSNNTSVSKLSSNTPTGKPKVKVINNFQLNSNKRNISPNNQSNVNEKEDKFHSTKDIINTPNSSNNNINQYSNQVPNKDKQNTNLPDNSGLSINLKTITSSNTNMNLNDKNEFLNNNNAIYIKPSSLTPNNAGNFKSISKREGMNFNNNDNKNEDKGNDKLSKIIAQNPNTNNILYVKNSISNAHKKSPNKINQLPKLNNSNNLSPNHNSHTNSNNINADANNVVNKSTILIKKPTVINTNINTNLFTSSAMNNHMNSTTNSKQLNKHFQMSRSPTNVANNKLLTSYNMLNNGNPNSQRDTINNLTGYNNSTKLNSLTNSNSNGNLKNNNNIGTNVLNSTKIKTFKLNTNLANNNISNNLKNSFVSKSPSNLNNLSSNNISNLVNKNSNVPNKLHISSISPSNKAYDKKSPNKKIIPTNFGEIKMNIHTSGINNINTSGFFKKSTSPPAYGSKIKANIGASGLSSSRK